DRYTLLIPTREILVYLSIYLSGQQPDTILSNTHSDKKNYTFINEHLSWKDAQAYCREHHTDLATIETAQESHEVVSKKPAGSIWFGLYRVAWSWSDRSWSAFRPWSSGQPDNFGLRQHCAAVSLHNALYYDKNCQIKLPFFCHGGKCSLLCT
uniref:C-type lectin domain-containing protein n=1 Tax=Myripristis murdjan TaxID=586833 RepID=A0A667WCD6_9TELE